MVIDPALDVWVWATALLLLVVLAARAWFVETGRARLGRTPVKVRALTATAVVVLAGLVGLLVRQGGAQLVDAIATGTQPVVLVPGQPLDPAAGGAPADPAADPAAPPGDPAAPPADPAAPAGDPAAPPVDPAAPPGAGAAPVGAGPGG